MTHKKTGGCSIAAILIVLASSAIPFPRSIWGAEPNPAGSTVKTDEAATAKLGRAWEASSDLIGTVNPAGIEATGGIDYRNSYRYDREYDSVSGYWQTGAELGITPAYLQPTLEFEWMPWIAAVLNIQYSGYWFFGQNGGLLSFSSPRQSFGDSERRALAGSEEKAYGDRLMFQPTLQFKINQLIIRNQSDLARYRFNGKGPYFLELEYDTLLKNGDQLLANRTQALAEISRSGDRTTLAGPFFELVHAESGDLTSKRAGLLFYSEQGPELVFSRSRCFCQLGYYLSDPNRAHGVFFRIGLGGDFDLNGPK